MSESNNFEEVLAEEPFGYRKKRRRRRKYVRYSPLSLVLLAICGFVFSFSVFGLLEQPLLDYVGRIKLGSFGFESIFNSPEEDDVGALRPTLGPVDGSKWQAISPTQIDKEKLPFLQKIDFRILEQQNEETVAWMYWPTTIDVDGLPFNLPVVQTSDNDYYLSHSFDHSASANGWVFADYRCNMEGIGSSRNTIIYAHARSYHMFGGLRFLNKKTAWQQDGNNHFIYINTPYERTVWQLFAWYETTTDFNYIQTDFSSDIEYMAFLYSLRENNTVPYFEEVEFSPKSQILTLSTCKGVNSNVRVAMHAVLVKYEKLADPEIKDPANTEKPTGTQTPVDTETPADTETSVNPGTSGVQKPAGSENTTDTKPPVDSEHTTDTETPVDTENATDTERPSDTENSTDAEDGTDTDQTTDSAPGTDVDPDNSSDTENPADTDNSADTDPSAEVDGPADTENTEVSEGSG
ncbi:MAG: sortase [Clostridia bacterium]|nr:sortase [Clostridia bacterium]